MASLEHRMVKSPFILLAIAAWILCATNTSLGQDQYLVGDWNGDGKDDIAIRSGSRIAMDTNGDGVPDTHLVFGNGDSESQYLVGDWDGDGRDNIAVRRGSTILMDTNFDSYHDIQLVFGDGNEEQYLVGDWDGGGRDNIAVRRGSTILMDTNFDSYHDIQLVFGNGDEEQYLAGDWDGDGRDNIFCRTHREPGRAEGLFLYDAGMRAVGRIDLSEVQGELSRRRVLHLQPGLPARVE